MVGYLVVHNEFGPGKIVGAEGQISIMYFYTKGVMKFGKAAIEQNAFSVFYPGAWLNYNKVFVR